MCFWKAALIEEKMFIIFYSFGWDWNRHDAWKRPILKTSGPIRMLKREILKVFFYAFNRALFIEMNV